MEPIPMTIHYINISIDAYLIREATPRLALCQDRIVEIDKDNQVMRSLDLLNVFEKSELASSH